MYSIANHIAASDIHMLILLSAKARSQESLSMRPFRHLLGHQWSNDMRNVGFEEKNVIHPTFHPAQAPSF
jgi:hypothetical protein